MKVNNIILGILIKISVTLFNYSLYYKIEACCPNFPLIQIEKYLTKLEFISIIFKQLNSQKNKCCLIQYVFIKLIHADDFQNYTIEPLLNCFN